MPALGDSSYCGTCWAVYLTRNGHNCPGPRRAALTLGTQNGPPWSLTPQRASHPKTEGTGQGARK